MKIHHRYLSLNNYTLSYTYYTVRKRVVEMFYHAYDNYIYNAYPFDELKPITCQGFDTWGRLIFRPQLIFKNTIFPHFTLT